MVVVAFGAIGCGVQRDEVALPAAVSEAPTTPFVESGGLVVMEAEHATGTAPGTGIAAGATWTEVTMTGASGGVAIEATPNVGVKTLETTVGPRRDFTVRFATAGTYQLWVRARGLSSDDDTIHAGVNGTAVTLGASGLLFPPSWTWLNTVGSRRVTIIVASPGLATINLWMREDGVIVDKILLTTSSSLVPSGAGPGESPHESQPPPDGGAPPPSGAFLESGGQVAMEAEHATGSAPGTGIAAAATWTPVTMTGASGGTALLAAPNAGVKTLETTVGPRRDYLIRFTTAGTYQLWVRGRGLTSDDDTIHAGVNGAPVTLGASGLLFPPSWTWLNTVGSRRVTIVVASPGLATINLWMREDGVIVDKILLTTSTSFVPSGTGPAESPMPQLVLPPGHSWCDESCLAQAPAQITTCLSSNLSCTPARATTVTLTLGGRAFTGLHLPINGDFAISRVDSGPAQSETPQQVMLLGGRAVVRSDVDVTLTHYDVPPVWGGTTNLDFALATFPGARMTTEFYWYTGYAIGDAAEQVHQAVESIISDEIGVAGLAPTTRGLAYFVPSEVAQGDGNFASFDGSVEVTYGNPPSWAQTGQSILDISAHEFAHEYSHQILFALSPPYQGNNTCLNEGLANSLGYVVGRIPASKLGPIGNLGENFDGNCQLTSEIHDVGDCYFHHVRKAGLLTAAFMRSIFHPQHAYSFDSCSPGDMRTGNALVVMFTEATGQDQAALVTGMNVPNAGSYAAAKAQLGF